MEKKVYIQLIIFCTVYGKNENCILSVDKDTVKPPIKPWQSLKLLIKEYTELSFNWMQPKLFDVRELENCLYIIYSACLPEHTPLQKGYWVEVEKCEDVFIKDLINSVINI